VTTPGENSPRDAGNWAKPVGALHVDQVSAGTRNLVDGKRLVGPLQGFGKMWQKTYRARLEGAERAPAEVIREWKHHFPHFWPEGNAFYPPLTGIAPGEIALIEASVAGGLRLSTGVMVMYADEESFTLITPQGHPLAGWVTFSATMTDGVTTAQAQVLMRAQDPLSELGLSLGGHGQEDQFWQQTLSNLAAHLGAETVVETLVTCVDKKRQWSKAGNVRHSSALRFPVATRKPRQTSR
jgi:hypothetical protein